MLRLETIICTFSVLSVAARAEFKARNCSEVREASIAKGFGFSHVPHQEIPGKGGLSLAHDLPVTASEMIGNMQRLLQNKIIIVNASVLSVYI